MVRKRGEPRSRENQLSQIPHLPYIKGVTKVLIKKDIIATFKPLKTIIHSKNLNRNGGLEKWKLAFVDIPYKNQVVWTCFVSSLSLPPSYVVCLDYSFFCCYCPLLVFSLVLSPSFFIFIGHLIFSSGFVVCGFYLFSFFFSYFPLLLFLLNIVFIFNIFCF